MKSPLAAWLYAHLATHDDFRKGMRYETLQGLAGLTKLEPKQMKRVAKAALAILEKQGHVAEVNLSKPDVFHLRPTIKAPVAVAAKKRTSIPPASRAPAQSHVAPLAAAQPAPAAIPARIQQEVFANDLPCIEDFLDKAGKVNAHRFDVCDVHLQLEMLDRYPTVHRNHPALAVVLRTLKAKLQLDDFDEYDAF